MTSYNREQAEIGEYGSEPNETDTPDETPTDTPDEQPTTPPNQEPVSPQPVPDSEPVVKESSS